MCLPNKQAEQPFLSNNPTMQLYLTVFEPGLENIILDIHNCSVELVTGILELIHSKLFPSYLL